MNSLKTKNNTTFFFDRDGVLNKDKGYVYLYKDFEWLSGSKKAIQFLNKKKSLVVVITNQSGIARGYYKIKDLRKLHNLINRDLQKINAKIDRFYFCPYHPLFKSYKKYKNLRKPKPGMILKAIKDFKLKKSNCVFIGDKKSDLLAAKTANIKFYYKSKKKNLYQQVKHILSSF